MANHMRFASFDVLPRGHASLPQATKISLSDYDQVVTGNHTTPCVVYPFHGNKDEVVATLQTGLQNVLTCLPLVGGELLNEDGRLWILRRNHEALKLGVHHLDADPNFQSYGDLGVQGFPASFFSSNATLLMPPDANLAGLRRDDGCPVAVFQVNFIKGGIILTLALHHVCGDAKSIDHVFELWAASSKAAAEKKPPPTWEPFLDRAYFNAAGTPSKEEVEKMKQSIRGFSFHPIAESMEPSTDPPKIPSISITMYHFSSASCAELKKLCTPPSGCSVRFVSSYDCMCALTWRCLTRARIPYLKPDLALAETLFAHPVDTRGRFGPIPNSYFGNSFMMAASAPLRMSELIGDGGLATAAHTIRACTEAVTVRAIPDIVSVRKGIEGDEEMRWIWHPENVVGTSWTGMHAVRDYDFGFGLPVSLGLPVPPFEGVFGVLHANRNEKGSDGFDMFVVLEEGCQARLRQDSEFRSYCRVVGE